MNDQFQAPSNWDKRADGSDKGQGFLGLLQRPDGKVSSEISIGVNLDGQEVEIPTMVPTLSQQERDWLINNDVSDPSKLPRSIIQKAVDFARQRKQQGKSFFAQATESPSGGGRWNGSNFVPAGADLMMTSRGQSRLDPTAINSAIMALVNGMRQR